LIPKIGGGELEPKNGENLHLISILEATICDKLLHVTKRECGYIHCNSISSNTVVLCNAHVVNGSLSKPGPTKLAHYTSPNPNACPNPIPITNP